MKHPASPAATAIASVREVVPELELPAVERAVMERVLTGKEMRVLLPAESSLLVVVLTAALSACLIVWPRMTEAVVIVRTRSEDWRQ